MPCWRPRYARTVRTSQAQDGLRTGVEWRGAGVAHGRRRPTRRLAWTQDQWIGGRHSMISLTGRAHRSGVAPGLRFAKTDTASRLLNPDNPGVGLARLGAPPNSWRFSQTVAVDDVSMRLMVFMSISKVSVASSGIGRTRVGRGFRRLVARGGTAVRDLRIE